jgi:hypothetical protein
MLIGVGICAHALAAVASTIASVNAVFFRK